MLYFGAEPDPKERTEEPATIDPGTCKRIKTLCESTKAELSKAIEDLRNTSDFKLLDLSHKLIAASNSLSKVISELEKYTPEEK